MCARAFPNSKDVGTIIIHAFKKHQCISSLNSTTLGQAVLALVGDAVCNHQNVYYIVLFLECFNSFHPLTKVNHYFDHHSVVQNLKEKSQLRGTVESKIHWTVLPDSFQVAWE